MAAIYRRLLIEKANGFVKPISDTVLTEDDVARAQTGRMDYLATRLLLLKPKECTIHKRIELLMVSELANFSNYLQTTPESTIKQYLISITAKLQMQCGQLGTTGSTLLATIIHKHSVYTITLGECLSAHYPNQ